MAYTLVPTELIQDGAVTSAKLDTNIAISGTLSVAGVTTLATHLVMGDNDKIKIGTGGDLEIYHDASNSYIANSTGNLYIGDTNGSVHIQAKLNEDSIVAAADGAVTLYYDNAAKLATTSTGIDVTGDALASSSFQVDSSGAGYYVGGGSTGTTAIGLLKNDAGKLTLDTDGARSIHFKTGGTLRQFIDGSTGDISFYNTAGNSQNLTWDASADSLAFVDNAKATFGAGDDLQIYHNGSNSFIKDTGDGILFVQGSGGVRVLGSDTSENLARFNENSSVQLYYDNAEKLATTATGIDVTGTATMDGLTVEGSSTGTITPVNILNTDSSANQTATRLGLGITNSSAANYTYIEAKETGVDAFADMNFYTGVTATKRMTLGVYGDISFYEDTGTTAKLFWDASAESLGIGTTSPYTLLELSSTDPIIRMTDSNGVTDKSIYEIRAIGASGSESLEFRTVNDANNSYNKLLILEHGGNVGIGVEPNAPNNGLIQLDVGDNGCGLTSRQNNELVIQANANYSTYAQAGKPATRLNLTNTGQFIFSNAPSGTSVGDAITFTPRMTLDSSGNLLVGTTDDVVWDNSANSAADNGHNLRDDGRSGFSSYQATANSNSTINVNRTGSDGDVIRAFKSGSLVGSIGVNTGDKIYLGTGASGVAFSTAGLLPFSPSANNWSDNSLNLGLSGIRWKDLYLSGGVHLGGTTAANKLDDYEEGTWTPNWAGLGNGSASGTYTKVGNIVHITALFTAGSTTSISKIEATNLPFTCSQTTYSGARYENYQQNSYLGATRAASSQLRAYIINVAGTHSTEVLVSASVPFTWGVNDYAQLAITYKTG